MQRQRAHAVRRRDEAGLGLMDHQTDAVEMVRLRVVDAALVLRFPVDCGRLIIIDDNEGRGWRG